MYSLKPPRTSPAVIDIDPLSSSRARMCVVVGIITLAAGCFFARFVVGIFFLIVVSVMYFLLQCVDHRNCRERVECGKHHLPVHQHHVPGSSAAVAALARGTVATPATE